MTLPTNKILKVHNRLDPQLATVADGVCAHSSIHVPWCGIEIMEVKHLTISYQVLWVVYRPIGIGMSSRMGRPKRINASEGFVSGSIAFQYISMPLWNLSTSNTSKVTTISRSRFTRSAAPDSDLNTMGQFSDQRSQHNLCRYSENNHCRSVAMDTLVVLLKMGAALGWTWPSGGNGCTGLSPWRCKS